jgi:hypothetical protein
MTQTNERPSRERIEKVRRDYRYWSARSNWYSALDAITELLAEIDASHADVRELGDLLASMHSHDDVRVDDDCMACHAFDRVDFAHYEEANEEPSVYTDALTQERFVIVHEYDYRKGLEAQEQLRRWKTYYEEMTGERNNWRQDANNLRQQLAKVTEERDELSRRISGKKYRADRVADLAGDVVTLQADMAAANRRAERMEAALKRSQQALDWYGFEVYVKDSQYMKRCRSCREEVGVSSTTPVVHRLSCLIADGLEGAEAEAALKEEERPVT